MAENGTQSHRGLSVIAEEIRADWSTRGKGVSPYAEPYLSAMATLDNVRQNYYADPAASIVRYFLANASSWRGDKARAVKAELKSMVEGVH